MRVSEQTRSGAPPGDDWRAPILKRISRPMAAVTAPAAAFVALSPGAFVPVARIAVLGIAVVVAVIALLAGDPKRTRALAALLIATLCLSCLVVVAEVGFAPGAAVGLLGALVFVAIFFGGRAVWSIGALAAAAILVIGAAATGGLLHPQDPAAAFDWSKMSVWLRVCAAFVAGTTIAGASVAAVIARFEDSIRERDRLLVAERRAVEANAAAVTENARLFAAERRAHEAARTSAARAETANRLKDEFLSTVSHELRTPLNAITGWTQMLRSGIVPPHRRDHALQVIERNARAQAKLIADLLDVSRIGSGRLRLNVEPVETAKVVQMAIDSVRPAAEAKGVRIDATFDGAALVLGDAGRLQQVVCNLLTNAVRHSPDGGKVGVDVRQVEHDTTITVLDHGRGIPSDFLPFLFEPFRQAEATFARSHGGLGLGLTIAKRLVELHGGRIDAKSEGEGCGATFSVRLPTAPLLATAMPAVPGFASEPALGARRELEGLRVLLVEDQPDTRELLLALLEQCGADVCGTSSAAGAADQFRRQRPDLLLSDIGLPGEDGLALIRRLRAMPGGDVPAVALTAFARAEDREASLAAGFDAHVSKPIEPERLLQIVTRLLRERRKPAIRAGEREQAASSQIASS